MATTLTAEQKRRIRQELQRRAQAKVAWKAGGGTSKLKASMKDWAGFGGTGSDTHKAQLEYIKQINKNKKFKEKTKAATKKGAAKGKAKVETYISKKAKTTAGGAAKVKPSKAMTTKKVDPAKKKHSDAQAWYRKHKAKAGGNAAQLKKVRATYKKKFG